MSQYAKNPKWIKIRAQLESGIKEPWQRKADGLESPSGADWQGVAENMVEPPAGDSGAQTLEQNLTYLKDELGFSIEKLMEAWQASGREISEEQITTAKKVWGIDGAAPSIEPGTEYTGPDMEL